MHYVNTLRLRQNVRHFLDNIFKRIFLNENIQISINNSLESVAKGPMNNIPALVQIMAWRLPGDKIIWTNGCWFTDPYMRQLASMSGFLLFGFKIFSNQP